MVRFGITVAALLLFSGRCGPGFVSRPAPTVTTRLPSEVALVTASGDGFQARWVPDPAAQAAPFDSLALVLEVEAQGPDHFVSVKVTDCERRVLVDRVEVGASRSIDDTERVFDLNDQWSAPALPAVCATVHPVDGDGRILVGGGLAVGTFGAPWLVEVETVPPLDEEDTD